MTDSLAQRLASEPKRVRDKILADLTKEEREALAYDWSFWGRPEQQYPDGDWSIWLLLGGRGVGKSRTGSETVRRWHHDHSRIALVAETKADGRDVMVEGDAGILACSPPDERPIYEPSKRRLTWPNGSIATLYSGDEPDQLRGPSHGVAWLDELAKFKYAQAAWDNLMLGLRLGSKPRVAVTTTPRPIPIIRTLVADERVHLTRETTYANLDNLAVGFQEMILARYEGTTLGRQELYAEIVESVEGALWTYELIGHVTAEELPKLRRKVVFVDPSTGSGTGDECGIVVAGLGWDGLGYVLDDRTVRGSPNVWGEAVVAAYHDHEADALGVEAAFGQAELAKLVLQPIDRQLAASFRRIPVRAGKRLRAEPVLGLYEQGRVKHVGMLPSLEDEMCSWAPDESDWSPNRVDALVGALTELMLAHPGGDATMHIPAGRIPEF